MVGREETIPLSEPMVKFAPDASLRLEWLLKPNTLVELLETNPGSAVAAIVKEQGKPASLGR
jgi:hypothetical protein